MEVRFDRDDDAAYVRYIQEEVDRTQQIDNSRLVDWSATDAVIGVEFLDVSDGVLTADLPVDVVALQDALVHAGIGVLDRLGVVGEGVHLGAATDGMGAQQPLPHPTTRTLHFAPVEVNWGPCAGDPTTRGAIIDRVTV